MIKLCKSIISTTLLSFILYTTGCQAVSLFLEDSIETTAQFPLIVTQISLIEPDEPCTDRFISHPLDHVTQIQGEVVRTFDSNGSGLGINDLDNDGDLDLVLANLAGPNAIFWNEGNLNFQKEEFPHGQSRGVNIVDIDGDGWQDIVFAHRHLRPFVWLNNGNDLSQSDGLSELRTSEKHHFRRLDYFSVSQRAYTMSWADMDRDNDLDIVVATYQTEHTRDDYLDFGNGGVVYYENVGERFEPTHLAFFSQALALLLVDLNEDGYLDIWVGHDFLLPDQVWLWHEDGWQETLPFDAVAQNTMSFAPGDIDNDGRLEIFSADMKPYALDSKTMQAWEPLMKTMEEGKDAQVLANVLLAPSDNGLYQDQAPVKGLDATGWSWSSQFGDLDNDGFLDLYVVNGMGRFRTRDELGLQN
ncbi:VCBS repeat-containing protein [Chloroflexi bacterium TSY]|nr:VCBS repeat-containing protein [Chloroflexi bacterium TSY]